MRRTCFSASLVTFANNFLYAEIDQMPFTIRAIAAIADNG